MKRKRIISVFLVAMLLMVSFNWAYGKDSVAETDAELYLQQVQEARKGLLEEIDLSERKNQEMFPGENSRKFEPDQQVRIIVELHGKPVPYGLKSKDLLNQTMSEQSRIIEDVKQVVDLEARHQFVQGFYGFSAETEYQNVATLERQRNVKQVYIAERFTLDMSNSRKIINTDELVEVEGLYGDGTVIAILDSGVDPDHTDWEDLDGVDVKITEDKFNKLAKETDVEEVYYNSKVPTGYDWADKDNDVTGYRSNHGIHVAGTAAGNGRIKGIAPNAQILAEKVFSDYDEYAYEDDIVAGILHAVTFEADVINMSLGSTAAFLDPDRPYHQAISYAVDQGVVVAVSAGNSAFSTLWSYPPYAENPDIGLVGSPGLWYDTIQVASYENDYVTSYFMEYGNNRRAQYTNSGPNAIIHFNKEDLEIEYAGFGGEEADYEGKDFTGKVALVERGVYSFVEKIAMAEAQGAIGVIVYNNAAGGDELLSMAYPEDGTIPAVFVGRTAGVELHKLVDSGNATVKFAGKFGEEINGNRTRMAGSTSWGLTSDLAFKPEITAPGANIWSLSNNDLYTNMSGTSMAAPHVTGGSALLVQYLRKHFDLSQNRDQVEFIKLLLMNTSEIILDPDNSHLPYSPRRQGAGLMKLDRAVQTPAYVYTNITDDHRIGDYTRKSGAVTLRDDVTQTFELNLSTINEAELSVPYVVYSSVYTDDKQDGFLTMKTRPLVNAELKLLSSTGDHDDTVTGLVYASAGEINTLTFQLDLSEVNFEPESFVEGFIELRSLTNENPTLSVPFAGFYGDWNRPKTIDTAFWEGDSYTEYTGLYDNDMLNLYNIEGYPTDFLLDNYRHMVGLGFNMKGEFSKDTIAISPFTDFKDSAQAVYTLLRNAREFKLVIVDEKNQVVKELFDNGQFTNPDGTKPFEEGIRKNVLASSPLTQYPALFSWDGTDQQGNIVPEGQYYFKVITKIHYDHIRPISTQSYKIPVKVDLTPLKISNLRIEGDTLKWEVDNSDLFGYTIFVNGDIVKETMDNTLQLPGISEQDSIVVVAEDIAGNLSSRQLDNQVNKPDEPEKPDSSDNSRSSRTGSSGTSRSRQQETPKAGKEIGRDGGLVEMVEGRLSIHFPAGALSENTLMSAQELDKEVLLRAKEGGRSQGYQTVTDVYSLVFDPDRSLNQPITLIFPLDKVNQKDKRLMGVYKYIERINQWIYVGGSINREGAMTAEVDSLGTYGVLYYEKIYQDMMNHWAKDEVMVTTARHITRGISDDIFDPNGNITRAQFAALLVRALNLPQEPFQGLFKDVQANQWFAIEVEAAARAGLVMGHDGSFNPDDQISREAMATMLIRALKYSEGYHPAPITTDGAAIRKQYSDTEHISSWAVEPINEAVARGLMTGMDATTFAPRQTATRAQAAVTIYRLLQRLNKL